MRLQHIAIVKKHIPSFRILSVIPPSVRGLSIWAVTLIPQQAGTSVHARSRLRKVDILDATLLLCTQSSRCRSCDYTLGLG